MPNAMYGISERSPKSKRVVVDVDDTLCYTEGRDYANASPNRALIAKLAVMRRDGWKVTLFTARGQVSCNGDLDLIHATVKPTLVDWLERNAVEYDELIFGKPYADLYIDDKGVTPEDFLRMEV